MLEQENQDIEVLDVADGVEGRQPPASCRGQQGRILLQKRFDCLGIVTLYCLWEDENSLKKKNDETCTTIRKGIFKNIDQMCTNMRKRIVLLDAQRMGK